MHRVSMGSEDTADGDKALLNDKATYRFHMFPIKTLADIFAEIDKINLEC